MSEMDDGKQWGWSHSEAVLELQLPAVGAVIDLDEQEKMISQWHGCREERGSAAVPGIGMQGSKMVLGENPMSWCSTLCTAVDI